VRKTEKKSAPQSNQHFYLQKTLRKDRKSGRAKITYPKKGTNFYYENLLRGRGEKIPKKGRVPYRPRHNARNKKRSTAPLKILEILTTPRPP